MPGDTSETSKETKDKYSAITTMLSRVGSGEKHTRHALFKGSIGLATARTWQQRVIKRLVDNGVLVRHGNMRAQNVMYSLPPSVQPFLWTNLGDEALRTRVILSLAHTTSTPSTPVYELSLIINNSAASGEAPRSNPDIFPGITRKSSKEIRSSLAQSTDAPVVELGKAINLTGGPTAVHADTEYSPPSERSVIIKKKIQEILSNGDVPATQAFSVIGNLGNGYRDHKKIREIAKKMGVQFVRREFQGEVLWHLPKVSIQTDQQPGDQDVGVDETQQDLASTAKAEHNFFSSIEPKVDGHVQDNGHLPQEIVETILKLQAATIENIVYMREKIDVLEKKFNETQVTLTELVNAWK